MKNEEQSNFLAKAIADSYCQTHEQTKQMDSYDYVQMYLSIFEMAKEEIIRREKGIQEAKESLKPTHFI